MRVAVPTTFFIITLALSAAAVLGWYFMLHKCKDVCPGFACTSLGDKCGDVGYVCKNTDYHGCSVDPKSSNYDKSKPYCWNPDPSVAGKHCGQNVTWIYGVGIGAIASAVLTLIFFIMYMNSK